MWIFATQIFSESKLSNHIETGDIYYDKLNINESIFDRFSQEHDKTKKLVSAILSYGGTFVLFIKEFFDDIDCKTTDRFGFFNKEKCKVSIL